MIFVTVGTHEQQFDRLVKCVDELKGKNVITEEVVIQTGYSGYEPLYCFWSDFFPYKSMLKYAKEARIIITHGGPSSFIMALQLGKTPIVVPRKYEYEEHVNNHQLNFCLELEKRKKNIICVQDVNDLENIIVNYDKIVNELNEGLNKNNENFNKEFEKIVMDLFK